MIDLVQYRTSIGLFASITSRSTKKRNTKLSYKTSKKVSKPEDEIKTIPKEEDVARGQCFVLQLFTVVLCFHFLCSYQFFSANTDFHKLSDMFCGHQCTSTEILHCNVYDNVECWEILEYGNVQFHNNMLSVNYSDTVSYSDVNRDNISNFYFHGNRSEHRLQLPSDIYLEHFYCIHQSITVVIQSLEMCPYPGTCCYLLGNKGMHCYNGNPPTDLTVTEKKINKLRLGMLLCDAGGQVLRDTISRIVLDILLDDVNIRTWCQLCKKDLVLLYPAELVLPSLDGLSQAGIDMVWTKALQQSSLTSGVTQDMIYDYLVSDGLDVQLRDDDTKDRLQKLPNHVLSKEQWDKLYPPSGDRADLESFDTTLLAAVLRNVFQIVPTSGDWSKDPHPGDVGIGDDILRLRKQRNKLAHYPCSGMDDNTFKTAWTEIRDILLRLRPDQKFSEEIQGFHDCSIDPTNAARIEKLIKDWKALEKRTEQLDREMSKMHTFKAETRKDLKRQREDLEENRAKVKKLEENVEDMQKEKAGQSTEDNRPKMMQATVKSWRKENIYKTKGVDATQEKILSQECVCVVGVPGAGKSTAIHHAALHLEEKGFIVYLINEPKEFVNYFDEDKKQVFILDDVLGIHLLDQSTVKLWDENNANIRSVLGTNTKLLVSVRTQLYNQAVKGNNFVFLDKSTCIDFSDKTYRLDGADMLGMLTHYLAVKGVDKVDDLIRQIYFPGRTEKELQDMTEERRQEMLEKTVGQKFSNCFPLLCKVFCREEFVRHNPRQFFTNPFPALTQIFEKIKSENSLHFCGLALCTVFDGMLTEDMFSIDCERCDELDKQCVTLRNLIMTSCHLEGQEYLQQIKSALNSLDGVYVTHVENRYQMSHRVFHDVVTYLFNETDRSFVLKYGTRDLIRDRITLSETQAVDDPYMITINNDIDIERLADRMFRELKSDTWTGTEFIANNTNIDDDRLISCLKIKLTSDGEQTLIDYLFFQCMWTVRYYRYKYEHGDVTQYKLIEMCLQTGVDCNMAIENDVYPLDISVRTGSVRLTHLLLNNGADKRRAVGGGHSILHTVCRFTKCNKVELVKLLAEHGEEVGSDHNILTKVDEWGRNILHWAVDDYVLTEHLLTYPCLQRYIYKCDEYDRTAYWYVLNNKKPGWLGGTKKIKGVVKNKDGMINLYNKYEADYYSSNDNSFFESSDCTSEEEKVEVVEYDSSEEKVTATYE